MQIIGGKVSFKRSFQPEQYGSKGADVEISFSLTEGEQLGDQLDKIGAMVKAKALELCGIKTEKNANAPADVAAAAKPMTATEVTERTNAAVKETVEKIGAKEAAAAAITAKEKAKAEKAPKPEKTTEAAPAKPADDFSEFDEDAAESQPEITQDQMTTAMNRKVAELKEKHGGAAPTMIKALINTFVEPPKKSHDIPQNLRAEFLKKLEALI
jgi:hypothetical protein